MLGEEDTGSQLARELELPNCPWAAGPLELEGCCSPLFGFSTHVPFLTFGFFPGAFLKVKLLSLTE